MFSFSRSLALLATAVIVAIATLPGLAADDRDDYRYPYGSERDREYRDKDDRFDSKYYEYRPASGPYSVNEISRIVLRDGKRDRDVPVRIFYPRAERKFPVIIFSHGAGGSKENYTGLTRFWASYGYVTIQPTHDDSIRERRRNGDDDYYLRDSVGDALFDTRAWEERARDISFIINSLDDLQRRYRELRGNIDDGRIGVGGHSFGAQTAMLVGGARVEFRRGGKLQSFRDGDVDAILALSPQGAGEMGFTRDSWDKVGVPMMTMTGSKDTVGRSRDPEWRMDPFSLSPRGDKYHVFLEGANHMTFAGNESGSGNWFQRVFSRRNRSDSRLFDYVQIATIAFWDSTLKREDSAERYLESRGMERLSDGAVRLSAR